VRLIVDTCVFIWIASARHRLSPVAADLLADPQNQVLVCARRTLRLALAAPGRSPGLQPWMPCRQPVRGDPILI
jgi:hypothetical protein